MKQDYAWQVKIFKKNYTGAHFILNILPTLK